VIRSLAVQVAHFYGDTVNGPEQTLGQFGGAVTRARPSWIAAIEAARGPRYQAIIQAVRAAMVSGALRAGDRLPPQRDLARMLRLNLGTVTRAFDALRESGLIKGEVGRGTYLTQLSAADGPTSLWIIRVHSDTRTSRTTSLMRYQLIRRSKASSQNSHR